MQRAWGRWCRKRVSVVTQVSSVSLGVLHVDPASGVVDSVCSELGEWIARLPSAAVLRLGLGKTRSPALAAASLSRRG